MVPALLKWIGNKRKSSELIVSYMPKKINNYFEPFLGSGAVMAELLSSGKETGKPTVEKAHGGDVLPFLIEIFDMVQKDPEKLTGYYEKEILDYYTRPEEKYLEIRDRFNENFNGLDFMLLSRTCYSGIVRFRKADGYMSTPRGPHRPISPDTFKERVDLWHDLLKKADFECIPYYELMDKAQKGDLIYCDPPYTHSQTIIYGAQEFHIEDLFQKIKECKKRGVKVMLSINGQRTDKDISIDIPAGLFKRRIPVSLGASMIDRLQHTGETMEGKKVTDLLLLTW